MSILATSAAKDGAEIVIASLAPTGALLGVHVHLPTLATMFDPNDAAALAIVVAEEIAEPGGTGVPLDVDWGEGLVPHPETISWRLL